MDEVTFSLDKDSLLGKCKAEYMITHPVGLEWDLFSDQAMFLNR